MVYQRQIRQPDALMDRRGATAVTEVIPVTVFSGSTEPAFRRGGPMSISGCAFSIDIQVLTAPEIDDLNDLTEELPRLLIRSCTATDAPRPKEQIPSGSARLNDGGLSARRSGASGTTRRAGPPAHRRDSDATGAVHSRLIIAAIAAGALAAGTNAGANATQVRADPVQVAGTSTSQGDFPDTSGIQIVQVASAVDSTIHREELANGTAFAQERAQREARLRRPQFVFPARGILTSTFGARWGTLHGGLDIANAIGTPIFAASDGDVIASGPTPGFGMWVKIRDAAGTVTLYGHIDTATVQTGERVLAGDQIATMGNRGNSTGPHLHFEVHPSESEKTDPMSWLLERGVSDG